MKLKILLRTILTILVLIGVIIGGLFGLNTYSNQHPNNQSVNDWNKLNPVAPTYNYYVETQKPSKVEKIDKDFYIYHYNQTGYQQDGTSKKVHYTATKKLKAHHYLIIKEKSHTVLSYEEVKKSNIPKKVMNQLQN